MHILIVGGGIIGMMTAYLLRKRGTDVTLIDRQQTGQESTWAGGGIISPLYPWRYPDSVTRLAKHSQQIYPELVEELHALSGIDPEYIVNGLLVIAAEEEQQACKWATQHDKLLSITSSAEVEELEPELKQPLDSAIWMPTIAQVRNPRIAKSLKRALLVSGVKLLEDHSFHELITSDQKVIGIVTSQGKVNADKVILCTGAWTAEVVALFSEMMPVIEPVRGQMILFKGKPETLKRITLWDDRYAIPRKDGRILFGSTVEYTGFVKSVTSDAKEELYDVVTQRYPVLKTFEIEMQWAGLRPGSPSGVPYIAQHPAFDNLYINAGHFRNGIVLAPASCELMAKMVTGEATEEEAAPYSMNAERN